jgi:hypothetical protein
MWCVFEKNESENRRNGETATVNREPAPWWIREKRFAPSPIHRFTHSRSIAGLIFAGIFVLLGWLLFGCAQTHAPAKVPSTAAVRQDFQVVKQHAVETSGSVEAAKQNAAQLQDLGQRSSDKNVIMRSWLEWKQRQP